MTRVSRSSAGPALLTVVLACLPAVAHAQSFYIVRKAQVFIQIDGTSTGSGFSVRLFSPPTGSFTFSAQAATRVALALPNGTTQELPAVAPDGGFELGQGFTSQAALDAAYPAGTYSMTGAGLPALSFNLATDTYPASAPAVIVTGWSNNVLVLDPARVNTLTFGGHSSYATAGLAGHMSIEISGLSDDVRVKNEIISRAGAGLPVAPTGFNSFTIPAGTLTSGRAYAGELIFDTATTLDTTTAPNALVAALYSRIQRFFIVARTPGQTPPPAPTITAQPTGQVVAPGRSATLNLGVATGEGGPGPAPNVLWYFNGRALRVDGAKYSFSNGAGLAINNVTPAEAGRYYAHVVTAGGMVTSVAATLTVSDNAPPAIVRQPASVTVAAGSTAVFSVAASAAPGATYQWRFNNTALPASVAGAHSPTLIISNATAARAGEYSVMITGNGTATSQPATLTVVAAPAEPSRLSNLSILTPLAEGEAITLGTVLGGGTTGRKPLLARAAGPALAAFGVEGFLPDPAMTLNFTSADPAVVVATNDDWNGASDLSAAFTALGAFPFANAASKDAALFRPSLAAGNYTIDVRAAAGSGTVIAELYDGTAPESFTSTTPRLINVSVLKTMAAGSSLTAGFVIAGPTAKTVLIRAIGPGLGALGLAGFMPDPQLTLSSTSVTPARVLATNNDWNGDLALKQSASDVGAFAVSDAGSRDAILLMTLAPGNYTAEVSPVAGTPGGRAIVEIYEVP